MAESGEEVHSQVNNNKNLPETQSNLFTDDEAGNRDATVQKQSRPSSANKDTRPHSVHHTLHWFACVGEDYDSNGYNNEDLQKEREERIKQMKERQNEERQRKLEELKAQALAAQKFREQKEEERRRRMEDLRRRENDRRSQVEERRRAIQEADNERRQYIMQKNQARDVRMDAKRRNERSSIQFAFGSSTPRMIDTTDSGMCSSFWANRRATSITNVAYTGVPLTRRSSERELTDGSSKKRATSASGLDRSTDDMRRMSSSMYEVFNWASTSECPKKLTLSLAGSSINIDEPPSRAERAAAAAAAAATRKDDSADMSYQRTVNRRKTDLMPTIPSPRDSSRSSLGTHTPRTPGLRSGEITPNSLNTSRPGSAMSSSTTASGVVYRRSLPQSAGQQRKPRPASIAVTGVSAGPKEEKPPLPKISAANNTSSTSLERKRSQSGASTPARPPAAPTTDNAAKKHHTPSEKPRLGGGSGSARGTPKASSTPLQSPGPEKANRTMQDSLQKQKKQPAADDQSQQPQQMSLVKEGSSISAKSSTEEKVETVEQKQQTQEEVVVQSGDVTTIIETVEQQQRQVVVVSETKHAEEVLHVEERKVEQLPRVMEVSSHEEKRDEMKESTFGNKLEPNQALDGSNVDLMTASMIAKRINTEEEAKAALAERRRLAREEAERQAELERQRIAAEEEAEQQRQLEEEERLAKLEEETNRLVEEQRRLEEERLQQAIQEVEKREEEDRQRREEEARQKVEREEAEKKAREEAERQRIEMAERLKKEEKEREERRKRVEAIMSRTRAKGSANNTPTKQSEENKDNAMSKSVIETSNTAAAMVESTMSMTDSMLGSIEQQQQQLLVESTPQVPPTIEEKTELLDQGVQLLSLVDGDDQNQENNNSNDSSLTGNHNNNNNNNNNSSDTIVAVSNNAEYERSVTEKENLLLGSFNNNLNSNATSNGGSDNGSSQQPSSLESSSMPVVVATTNGKSTPGATTIAETTELIIEDAIMSGQTNGHKNGSIDNVLLRVADI